MNPKKQSPSVQGISAGKNYRRLLPAAFIVSNVIVVVINLFVLSLLGKRADTAVRERSEILAHELKEQSAQKLAVDLNSTLGQQQAVLQYLPDKTKLLDVIQFLEGLREVVGVRDFSFESDTPLLDAQGFGFLPVILDLEGSLSQTMVALSRLQRAPFLVTVDHTVIESQGGLSQAVRLRVLLRIYVSEPFAQNQ